VPKSAKGRNAVLAVKTNLSAPRVAASAPLTLYLNLRRTFSANRSLKLEFGSLGVSMMQSEARAQEKCTGTKLSANMRSVERNGEISPKFGIQKVSFGT
jgi:hypothetical protein